MASPAEGATYAAKRDAIENDLRGWWDEMSWDASIQDEDLEDPELWHQMPEIDSKVVVGAKGIFEDHLGIELDLELIQEGGYDSIDELVNHLVPAMIEKAKETSNLSEEE